MTTSTEKIWRPFLVGELFRLEQGKSKGLNHLEQDERGIPYLGATNRNNAVLAFVRPVEKLIQRGNCIAFIRNGEGSVGYSVYKQEDFIATSDITCGYADFLNKYVGLFMTTVADKVRGKYNFNYKRSDTRLKKERLMLPVNDDGSPNFVFMENYVRAVEEKILQRYRLFAQEKFSALETKKIPPLNEKRWAEFLIEEIFDISPGKRLTKAEMIAGDTPFIGASDSNNGVTAFVGNENDSADENVLGVNYDGSVAENFYHPYRCLFSDPVKRFKLKNFVGNEFVYLFLKAVILQQKDKFNYGYKFNESRMRRQKIFLPVNDEGAPDFEYMEAYVKNLEAEKYRKYLAYIGDD